VVPPRWMAAHLVARSREVAAPPLMSARVPAQEVPADWKSAVGVMSAARVLAQEAPADWRSAVGEMSAAKDIRRAEEFDVSWLKLRPGC
jgi:hypothetical protein